MKLLRTAALLATLGAAFLSMSCSSSDIHGSVDNSRLGTPCTQGSCANGGSCVNYSGIDGTLDTPFCVNTQNGCDLVKCDRGSCSITHGKPDVVSCHE